MQLVLRNHYLAGDAACPSFCTSYGWYGHGGRCHDRHDSISYACKVLQGPEISQRYRGSSLQEQDQIVRGRCSSLTILSVAATNSIGSELLSKMRTAVTIDPRIDRIGSASSVEYSTRLSRELFLWESCQRKRQKPAANSWQIGSVT